MTTWHDGDCLCGAVRVRLALVNLDTLLCQAKGFVANELAGQEEAAMPPVAP